MFSYINKQTNKSKECCWFFVHLQKIETNRKQTVMKLRGNGTGSGTFSNWIKIKTNLKMSKTTTKIAFSIKLKRLHNTLELYNKFITKKKIGFEL